MNSPELIKLNRKYGFRDQLVFTESPGGFVWAEIKNRHAEATVALHGGQILSYRPQAQAPVLWLSRKRYFQTGKAIRGGIPVCWPWFGAHPTDAGKPAHGFARTAVWSVNESEQLEDGGTRLKLFFAASEETLALWPHRFRLEIEVMVSAVLRVKLICTNTGSAPFTCTGALHSYFNISSISNVAIKGLEECPYLDKVDQGRRKVQAGPIYIRRETDRIYTDTTAACTIEDKGLERRIGIAKNGSRTTVVWNPWIDKSRRMPDFGDEEYENMVCVETANAAEDVVTLAPGGSHTLEQVVHVGSLSSHND